MARKKALAEERLAVLCKEMGIDKALALILTLHAYEKPNLRNESKPKITKRKKSLKTDPDSQALGEDVQLGGESKTTPNE